MKKTLVVFMVMVLGLTMTASALPPVTVDQCSGVFDMQLEFQILIGLLGSEIQGLPAPELLDIEGEGLTDYAKLTLLAAAMCEDTDLAAAFDANKATFMDFVAALFGLVTWAGGGVADATTAAAAALPTFTGNPVYMSVFHDTLIVFLQGLGMSLEAATLQADGAIIMLTDEATCDLLGLPYIPGELPGLAAELTGLGMEIPQNPYYAFAGAMETMVPNAFTALLSVSTELKLNLVGLIQSELLGDVAEYRDLLFQVGTMFTALAYVCQPAILNEPVLYATFGAFSMQLTAGVEAMDALALDPDLFPILGAVVKGEGEPFSALGDYDGDGVDNVTTWDVVGNDMALFVAAASGANPFYPGNPLMPAAGLIGLAALVSAIAGGGAFVLRKK